MFFLALIAILILGVISFGLLKLLSKSLSGQRSHPGPEPKTTPGEVNSEQGDSDQLTALSHQIEKHHQDDARRAKANRIENQMYILYGFAVATGSVAIAVLGVPDHNPTVVIIDAIIAFGFLGLGFWRFAILREYKKWNWKDPWGDKD